MPAKTEHTACAPRLPSEPGIPALPIETLLETQQDLIARIKLCFGMDRAQFGQSVMPLLTRYAATVHLLPCTADDFFSIPGGLLRIGLETAFYALQGSDAHIFSGRATITERTRLEPRWRRATFIAGLCCELHRTFSQFTVADSSGNEWNPYLAPLAQWLHRHGAEQYFLTWKPNAYEHRALGLFAVPFVVTAEDLQDLDGGHSQAVPHMLAAITGTPTLHGINTVESLVRRALALAIDCDLRAMAGRSGKPRQGSHLERYLTDTLRHLAASLASWRANAEKSRLWYGADGMFLLWPNAFEDLRRFLESSELPGIPKAPEAVMETLVAAGHFVQREQGGALWGIYPPGSKTALNAVKIASPGILFANTDGYPVALHAALMEPSGITPLVPTPQHPAQALDLPAPGSAPAQHVKPEQLPLPTSTVQPTAHQQDKPPPSPALPPRIKPTLLAPLRLPLNVRNALQAILSTLGTGSSPEASVMDGGLFVPLPAFKARKVDAPAAIRALAEVGMLAMQAPVTRTFQDKEADGVLIAPQFFQGLPSERHQDARPCV